MTSNLSPDRLRAMARAIAANDGRDWDELQDHARLCYLSNALACWEASPGGELMEALAECVATLALSEPVPHVDPEYGAEVTRLGRKIGFGALISSASAAWHDFAVENDIPGSEYTIGACRVTVMCALEQGREALRQALPQGTET